LSLYDNARLAGPKAKNNSNPKWEEIDSAVKSKLESISATQGKIRILSASTSSPSTKKVIADFTAKYPTTKHVVYDAVSYYGMLKANMLSFGKYVIPSYHFENADVIVAFATDFLANEIWNDDWGRIGAEICLSISAITGKYRVCQAFLGTKAHPDRSARDLLAAMRQTVGALFSSLDRNFPVWSTLEGSQPVPTIGAQSEVIMEPVRVNRKRLREMFATGVAQLEPVFRSILSASTLSELQRIATLEVGEFNYPAELWAKTVFEFAASYHRSVISRDHIVQALVPLYRGRTLTFLLENRDSSEEEIERNLESLCGDFERVPLTLLQSGDDLAARGRVVGLWRLRHVVKERRDHIRADG